MILSLTRNGSVYAHAINDGRLLYGLSLENSVVGGAVESSAKHSAKTRRFALLHLIAIFAEITHFSRISIRALDSGHQTAYIRPK